jgi:hypothetical protein
MLTLKKAALCLGGLILYFCVPNLFAAPEVKDSKVVTVEANVEAMSKTLKRLYKELGEAKKKNELPRVNCLLAKINLVKGLLKAGERAKGVFLESHYVGDAQTASTYQAKVASYAGAAREIEKSIDECTSARKKEEGTTLVYIRPEGDAAEEVFEQSPWDWNDPPGSMQYPAVPPASPFR